MPVNQKIEEILNYIQICSPGQDEFYQAAHEVLHSLVPLLEQDNRYLEHNILESIVVPERSISLSCQLGGRYRQTTNKCRL